MLRFRHNWWVVGKLCGAFISFYSGWTRRRREINTTGKRGKIVGSERNECSERSNPGMKWKVAEYSVMNEWTAYNAGCWCGWVSVWAGMECWGTKHEMEAKKWTYWHEAHVIMNIFSSLLHLWWVVGIFFVVIHFFCSFRGEPAAGSKNIPLVSEEKELWG